MKTLSFLAAFPLLLLMTGYSNPLHAQFFKQLLNSAKQTAQNRANDKTSQTTNSVLNKVDSSMQIKSKSGTSGTNGSGTSVTSPATASGSGDPSHETMKALGLMTGGGGVSASDSAAAIRSFMTGSGGSGVEYQYQVQTTSKDKKTMTDTTSIWFTNSGSGRSEMRINMPGIMSGKICNISRVSQPQYTILLNTDAKTYSLMVIDTSLINAGSETYEITVIGNETVNGYPCIHSKMKSTIGSGLFKSTTSMDMWTTKSVTGYDLFKRLCATANIKPQMMQALEKAGADGAMIKMASAGKGYSMNMTLVKAQEGSFPVSMFQIPQGYAKSDETMMEMMMSGAKH